MLLLMIPHDLISMDYSYLLFTQEKKFYGSLNKQSVSHKYLSNTDSPSREKIYGSLDEQSVSQSREKNLWIT
jgi:hypothetical protein